jgi:hypothetical protein
MYVPDNPQMEKTQKKLYTVYCIHFFLKKETE